MSIKEIMTTFSRDRRSTEVFRETPHFWRKDIFTCSLLSAQNDGNATVILKQSALQAVLKNLLISCNSQQWTTGDSLQIGQHSQIKSREVQIFVQIILANVCLDNSGKYLFKLIDPGPMTPSPLVHLRPA